MPDDRWMIEQFETNRGRLRSLALRMLGSAADADDALQAAWVKVARADAASVDNAAGWLTTVVSRVALDMLRQRSTRREVGGIEAIVDLEAADPGPEDEAVLAGSVSAAVTVVLDALAPAERLAFVLHDLFGVPFAEIGRILSRSTAASKQLAMRARAKVRAADRDVAVDRRAEREVVQAFLAAARAGDLTALIALLHPDVAMHADAAAVAMGSPGVVEGASDVAAVFSGRALGAQVATLDDIGGLVWIVGDRPKVVWEFAVADGLVVHVEMLASPATLADMIIVAM